MKKLLLLATLILFSSFAYADLASANQALEQKNYKKAFKEYDTLSKSGNLEAMYSLGIMYMDGKGIPRNDCKAFQLFKTSSELGYKESFRQIGYFYENGICVEKNLIKATESFEAVDDPLSKSAKAMMLYKEALKENHTAQVLFSIMFTSGESGIYSSGKTTYQDDYQAFYWAKKAADNGNILAQILVSKYYYEGNGTRPDKHKALEYLNSTVDNGYLFGLSMMAQFYFKEKKYLDSYIWWGLAEKKGIPEANKEKVMVGKFLSNQEIILADKAIDDKNKNVQINISEDNMNILLTYQRKKQDKSVKNIYAQNNIISMPKPLPTKDTGGWEDCNDLTPIINSSKQVTLDNKKWLLAIAVEVYDKTSPVIYSYISATTFAKVAQKKLGVPEQNSYLLIGDSATTGAVKDTIAKLADNIQDGDTIYFYYSGHGIPDPVSKESFILPKDKAVEYVAKEQELKLSNIYTTLQNSKASKIIAVVDACFSGMTDGQSIYKGVAAAHFKPKSFDANPNGKLVILTAGKDNQFSNSYDEKSHRLFSYFVIKSLLDGRKNIDDIYKDVAIKVKDESRRKGGDTYEQEPQMIGNSKLKL